MRQAMLQTYQLFSVTEVYGFRNESYGYKNGVSGYKTKGSVQT